MNTPRPIHFIVTEDRVELMQDIKSKLQILLGDHPIESQIIPFTYFKDTSPNDPIKESVRGKHVYVISDVYSDSSNKSGIAPVISDRYERSRGLLRTAQNFGAKTINVLYPAYPFARDDKFDHMGCASHIKRTPNRASMVIEDCVNRGVSYMITHDIHSFATLSFPKFSGITTNFIGLGYGWIIEETIKRAGIDKTNTVLSGTDEGSVKKIKPVCRDLQINKLVAVKDRDETIPQSVEDIQVYGDCTDKDVILYDDILDTGGTMLTCLRKIHEKQPRSVNLLISHGLFNGDSLQQLLEAHKAGLFTKLYITNSVLRTQLETFFKEKNYASFIETIDLSTTFAHTIASIAQEKDINYNNNTPILSS